MIFTYLQLMGYFDCNYAAATLNKRTRFRVPASRIGVPQGILLLLVLPKTPITSLHYFEEEMAIFVGKELCLLHVRIDVPFNSSASYLFRLYSGLGHGDEDGVRVGPRPPLVGREGGDVRLGVWVKVLLEQLRLSGHGEGDHLK